MAMARASSNVMATTIGQAMTDPAIPQAHVLVLGATSLVGRFLMPRLAAAGMPAMGLSRTAPDEAGWLCGDLADADLALILPQSHTVFSLAPIWQLPLALPALHRRGMRRLVAFSSTSVFTKAASPDPQEQAVARKLAAGEADTRAFCEARGVDWTLLRPTLIYAEGHDQNVSRLARLARGLWFLPLSGAGRGLRQPVHAEDLAEAAMAAAASPAALNKAYALPGGETLTYRTMVERVFQGLGRPPLILPVPQGVWRLAFAIARPFLPRANAQMGARMSHDLTFDGSEAARDFGWAPRDFRPNFRGV
jgi:nucleoside-diphosphate-sugar epimerase